MRIEWAIPARYVEVNQGLATIVGAGANVFTVPDFPAGIGLMVAVKIVAAEGDTDEHVFGNRVLGPDVAAVTERAEIPFSMGVVSPDKPEGWEQALVQALGVQSLRLSKDSMCLR